MMKDYMTVVITISISIMALGLLIYLIRGEKGEGAAIGLAAIGGIIFILGSNLPLILVLIVGGGGLLVLLFIFGGGKPPKV